jgi:two-component system, OmpR family, response regulator
MTTASPGKTILVVEYSTVARARLGTIISERGYQVMLVPNGLEALDYLRAYPTPDLIILDMLTPGIDGWQFLKERNLECSSIPVIITTSLSIASDKWAKSLGAVGVLRKPVEPAELLELVDNYVGSGMA